MGRFDLGDRPPVRYLAESPEHAIAEVLSGYRGTRFRASYLRHSGHALALVEVRLAESLRERIADCSDPDTLVSLGIRPDVLADHDRTRTQAIARRLHTLGDTTGKPAGLRWWSALTGAWHTTVVFTDRVRSGELQFGEPLPLQLADADLLLALNALGIRAK